MQEPQETWVQSLGWEDPLEEEMATHSNSLAWRIPMDRGDWWATVHEVAESASTEHIMVCPVSQFPPRLKSYESRYYLCLFIAKSSAPSSGSSI